MELLSQEILPFIKLRVILEGFCPESVVFLILITTDPGLQLSRMTTKQQKHPRTMWATTPQYDGKTEPISPYQNSMSVHQEQITKV